jgi:hypothetical protein
MDFMDLTDKECWTLLALIIGSMIFACCTLALIVHHMSDAEVAPKPARDMSCSYYRGATRPLCTNISSK